MRFAFRTQVTGARLGAPATKGETSMTMHLRVRTLAALAGAALLAAVTQGAAQNLKYKPISVKTPDGLTISAQEWGNPQGPEILLIHGYAQSHMSWMRQVDGDLAKEFRIITYDLRGH